MITVHGLNGNILNSVVAASIPTAIREIRFRSAFSSESTMLTGQEIVQIYQGTDQPSQGAGANFLRALKPTFTVDSPILGQKVIAPYGEADPSEPGKNRAKLALYGGLIAIGCVGLGMVLVQAIRS